MTPLCRSLQNAGPGEAQGAWALLPGTDLSPHITRHVGLVKRLDPGSVPEKKEEISVPFELGTGPHLGLVVPEAGPCLGGYSCPCFLAPRLYLVIVSVTTKKELVLGLENLQVGVYPETSKSPHPE